MDKNKKKDLLESLKRDIAFTTQNYSQMHAKFRMRDAAARLLMVYYSIVMIIYAVLPLYFEPYFDAYFDGDVLDFVALCLSVVSLVASLLISFAKYPERSIQTMDALDKLKYFKKNIEKYTADELRDEDCLLYDQFVEEYHQIVDKVELRTEMDYYRACKALWASGKYTDGWKNLSCFNKFLANISRGMEYSFYGILTVLPWALLVFTFVK